MGDHSTIAVVSLGDSIDGWHDLDGAIEENKGYYLNPIQLATFFSPVDHKEVRGFISKPFEYKEQNLMGLEFKLIQVDEDNNLLLVEFDKDINGFSGDSMGRRGHCMLIPNDIAEREKADWERRKDERRSRAKSKTKSS